MSEARLWKTLKGAIGHLGHVDRIESHATSQGRPDVNWCYQSDNVDIELKVYDPKKNGFVLRANQNAWMLNRVKAGGKVFIFARFDSVDGPIYLLIPGTRSRALIHERSYEAWHKQAIWVWQNEMDWEIFRRLVRAGMETPQGNPN
jgi:hypothetical protein